LPLRVTDPGVRGGWAADALGAGDDHAGALAEAEPVVGLAAQVLGDGVGEDVALDARQHAGVGGQLDVGGIGGHHDVRRRVGSLGDQTLTQLGVVAGGESHLDAGVGGELLEHRLDAVVPTGVHGDRAAGFRDVAIGRGGFCCVGAVGASVTGVVVTVAGAEGERTHEHAPQEVSRPRSLHS